MWKPMLTYSSNTLHITTPYNKPQWRKKFPANLLTNI